MPLTAGLACSVQVLIGSTWTTLAEAIDRVSIKYGLSGNRPTDCLAETGECGYTLRNDSATGHPVGYYSPLHGSVLPGWTFNLRQRVLFSYEAPLSVSSLTRASATATVTTSGAHGLATGDWVDVSGAAQSEYNIVAQITVTGATTFTYAVSGTPATPATGTITTQRKYIKFTGKIDTIDAEAGLNRNQSVRVRAYDYMRDLYDTDVVDVDLQVNQTEDVVIGAVLDGLPSANQPIARTLDAGLDPLPYALDDLGRGTRAAAVAADVIRSSYGLGIIKGDGTFRYISRNTRATTASSFTISDADMQDLRAPSSRVNVFNRIRTTNHPKTPDTSDVVLYALTGTPPVVPASDSVTIEGSFRDPNDARRAIGAISTVALASGTDYAGNSAIDGSGTDLSASLTVTPAINASRVVFTIVNASATPAYLVNASGTITLQIRGKGIYDNAPRTYETSSGAGDRLLNFDLPYAGNDGVTQQIGTFILSQYEDLSAQIDSVTLVEGANTTRLRQMLAREPGDVITISETVTGLSSVQAMILSCAYSMTPERALSVTWGLGPVIDVDPPNPPTGFAATVTSDSSATLSWAMGAGAGGAQTLIYKDGLLIATSGAGVTSIDVTGLARATTCTFTARHMLLSLLSTVTAGLPVRPVVAATGGTVTTPGDGYKYHTFTISGNFTITVRGRIDWMLAGAGGGGAGGGDNSGAGVGGGAGGGGGVDLQIDNDEPTSASDGFPGGWPVVIPAGGAGGVTDGTTGTDGSYGGTTTYRTNSGRGGGFGGGTSAGVGSVGGGAPTVGGGGGGGGGATGGVGGTGNSSTGGSGFTAGTGNTSGGGGGGGAGGNGTNATTGTGAAAGAALSTFAGSFGAGGIGGRGALGQAAGAANTGDGGGGGDNLTNGYAGGSGKAVFRYPI